MLFNTNVYGRKPRQIRTHVCTVNTSRLPTGNDTMGGIQTIEGRSQEGVKERLAFTSMEKLGGQLLTMG